MAKSVTDYVFRYLGNRFLRDEARVEDEQETEAEATGLAVVAGGSGSRGDALFQNQADSPPCPVCGSITVRSGTCYKCPNCGLTTGCS